MFGVQFQEPAFVESCDIWQELHTQYIYSFGFVSSIRAFHYFDNSVTAITDMPVKTSKQRLYSDIRI